MMVAGTAWAGTGAVAVYTCLLADSASEENVDKAAEAWLAAVKKVKVGDLVEVDDVTGIILRIGMRASVIEHFDGIETIVPNSVLLDNRVDNCTFGKTAVRFEEFGESTLVFKLLYWVDATKTRRE